MDPGSMEPIVERKGFTDMTKNLVSYIVWEYAVRIGYTSPALEDSENPPVAPSIESKLKKVEELETKLEKDVLIHCDPANPLAVSYLF